MVKIWKDYQEFKSMIESCIYIWNENRISFGKISFSANIMRIKYVYFLDKIHCAYRVLEARQLYESSG